VTAVTHGADPEALDLLAAEMLHAAERIALVGRSVLDILEALHGSGPDARAGRELSGAGVVLDGMELAQAARDADPAAAVAPAQPRADGGRPGRRRVGRTCGGRLARRRHADRPRQPRARRVGRAHR